VPFPRPRSLGGLVLLGFALVSLPLLLGVVSAAVQMSRLSESSQRLVVYGVQATQYSQALEVDPDNATARERLRRVQSLMGEASEAMNFDFASKGIDEPFSDEELTDEKIEEKHQETLDIIDSICETLGVRRASCFAYDREGQ